MAQKATKSETAIELPRLKIEMMEITLIGDTPLIVHAWSAKAKRAMLDKQMKRAKQAKEAKDPVEDFEASLYRLDEGYGFPAVGFKNAAVSAATSVDGITKVAARQMFHIVGRSIDFTGAWEGTRMRQNLVPLIGPPPRMREDMVKVMMTTDIRYRGEFWPWAAQVVVRFNANTVSAEQILNLFNTAGFAVGIGEWRPERDGEAGMFHVAQAGELEALLKEAA